MAATILPLCARMLILKRSHHRSVDHPLILISTATDSSQQIATFAFMNSGQVCLCLKRIYVQESIYEKFREAMMKSVSTFKVGNGLDDGTTHGPLQNSMQYERVRGFFNEIEKEKWKVAVGGKLDTKANGYYIDPTIIDNPPDSSRIVLEEPFGKLIR